jgi:hypothetical protein
MAACAQITADVARRNMAGSELFYKGLQVRREVLGAE